MVMLLSRSPKLLSIILVMLVYGDYPPSSEHVVETVYTGGSMETLIEAVNGWEFQGGTPIRNALHEGLAACLEVL